KPKIQRTPATRRAHLDAIAGERRYPHILNEHIWSTDLNQWRATPPDVVHPLLLRQERSHGSIEGGWQQRAADIAFHYHGAFRSDADIPVDQSLWTENARQMCRECTHVGPVRNAKTYNRSPRNGVFLHQLESIAFFSKHERFYDATGIAIDRAP